MILRVPPGIIGLSLRIRAGGQDSSKLLVGLPRAGIARGLGHILTCALDAGANVGDSITKGLAHIPGYCVDSLSQTSAGTTNNAPDGISNSGQGVAKDFAVNCQ